jgi:hypothetical protein
MYLTMDAHMATMQGAERSQATLLAQAGMEAVTSITQRGWKYVTTGTHGLTHEPHTYWEFAKDPETINAYTRQIDIAAVERDSHGVIVPSGGTLDYDTKKVTSRVTWDFQPNRPSEVVLESYVTNWNSTKWVQTSQADFDQGSKTNTVSTAAQGGELQLAQTAGTFGNTFLVESLNSYSLQQAARQLSFRFTAQSGGALAGFRVYVASVNLSPTYRFGIQSDSGSGLPSSTWLAQVNGQPTAAGWYTATFAAPVTIQAGTVYHLVIQYALGQIGANRRIMVRTTNPLNAVIPLTQVADAAANVLQVNAGSWAVVNQQPLYILNYATTTYEGNPVSGVVEETVSGNTSAGTIVTIGSSPQTVGAVSMYVRKNTNQQPAGDLTVSLRDAVSGAVLAEGVIVPRASASRIYSYQTYTFPAPVVLAAGRSYRLFLRSTNSVPARAYTVLRNINDAGQPYTALNAGGTDAQWISSTNGGTTWTATPEADLAGYRFSAVNGFVPSGTYQSAAYDTGTVGPVLNYLAWQATVPAGTSLRFQVRLADTQAGLSVATWVGPDNTSATYFTAPGQIIPGASGHRWVQYQAYLSTTDSTQSPLLYDTTLDYEQ